MIYQTSANDLYKKHILGLKVDKLMLSLITSKPRHRKECQHKYTLKGYWYVYLNFISFSYVICCLYLPLQMQVTHLHVHMWSNNPLKWTYQFRCSCRHVQVASFFKEFHASKGRGIPQHSLNRQGALARHACPQRLRESVKSSLQ